MAGPDRARKRTATGGSSTNDKDKPATPAVTRTAAQYVDPAQLRASSRSGLLASGLPAADDFITLYKHPWVTFAGPIQILATGYALAMRALLLTAEPLYGVVLARKYVDYVAVAMLVAGWMGNRAARIAKQRTQTQVTATGDVVPTPAMIDDVWLAALKWVVAAAMLLAVSPWTRDAAAVFAAHPRASLDAAMAPVVGAVMGHEHAKTTLSSMLIAWLPPFLQNLFRAAFPEAAYPAWMQPHVAHALALYPISFAVGVAASSIPFATVAPYMHPIGVRQHLNFTKFVVPILWFICSNVARTVYPSVDPERDPHHLAAGVAVVGAVASGIVIPVVYGTYTKIQGKWVPALMALATVALVAQSVSTSRHFVHSIQEPLRITPEYALIEKQGHIQVLADTGRDVLFLRSGHSLIGGMYRTSLDSVFAGFYFHDMHRLVADRALAEYRVQHTPATTDVRGLMIGYGIGIAANAYSHLNVSLDVVDIDKDVVDLARKHFPTLAAGAVVETLTGIDDPLLFDADPTGAVRVVVADGRDVLARAPANHYDFIAHDIFAGGSVAPRLFTYEAFAHARRALKPGGTLSVNMVGRPHDLAFRTAAKTLRSVFKYVRAFAEPTSTTDDHVSEDEVTNLVFYASDAPFAFRAPVEDDYFGSQMRWYALSRFRHAEVAIPQPPGVAPAVPVKRSDGEYYAWEGKENATALMDAVPAIDLADYTKSSKAIPSAPGQRSFSRHDLDRPRVLTDAEMRDLEELLWPVATAHWAIMRTIVPLDVWLEY
ncbi:hypothetical protein AMAG_14664 [Allomyces macrogynus ATCC 38327]|uniref:PABS domain-containing protein n=1 Tax=Allomyces macrogynus (strain ATCC 38327) TaxID=578462 RepID=A0A0L0T724_ALLM3|nr:hypothetical protein AMAG_14664 [Allomyces macrogynus ATCC 38327]|eukprot:KNE70542.1 hypothetical protein AMAG_14664 [Allomyces macrogynus ATCC 38327]